MLNRTLALSLLSVSFYGAYVVVGHGPSLELGSWQPLNPEADYAELLAQEKPENAPPHRGSGRCDIC